MADRPILFSGPMVRALLTGTKTQTRRLIKPQPTMTASGRWKWEGKTPGAEATCFFGYDEFMSRALLDDAVRYAVGDRLWVRETWNVADAYLQPEKRKTALAIMNYAATPWAVPGRWRSPIHMPRWASRLTLTVTDVRVQRLQEIGRGDAIAEGLTLASNVIEEFWRWPPPLDANLWLSPIAAYRSLWDSINAGRAPWDSNPWVCAITFKTALGNIDAISEAA